jgi:hypothetical protein
MAELLKISVTRKELDEGIIPQNQVLCHAYYDNTDMKTKSGIIIGVNKELIYNESDNPADDSAHAADFAEVSLRVYKLPQKLYYNPEDKDNSMPWETEMEICEDDIIFTNTIEALNAVTLVCEGELYKLIPYQDIICAKREIWADKWKGIKKTVVEMFNGYVLCEQVHKESLSEFDVTSADKIDPTKGEIAYYGSLNKSYIREDLCDFVDLRKGDIVLFDRKVPPFLLERQKYASQFDSEKLYWVVQRSRIVAVISRIGE